MNRFFYYWAKFVKKFRGSSILASVVPPSSKVEAGSNIIKTQFGRHSYCGYNCEISNTQIGSFCSIANNVVIGGGTHPLEWVSMSPVFFEGRDSVTAKFSIHKRPPNKMTVIGNDVWIGERALVKQGVCIGTGAVIGMGSVVTKDVQPYAVVAGCPAKEIKKRFDDRTIERLLQSEWWNFDEQRLLQFACYFTDPEEFLKRIGR